MVFTLFFDVSFPGLLKILMIGLAGFFIKEGLELKGTVVGNLGGMRSRYLFTF